MYLSCIICKSHKPPEKRSCKRNLHFDLSVMGGCVSMIIIIISCDNNYSYELLNISYITYVAQGWGQ